MKVKRAHQTNHQMIHVAGDILVNYSLYCYLLFASAYSLWRFFGHCNQIYSYQQIYPQNKIPSFVRLKLMVIQIQLAILQLQQQNKVAAVCPPQRRMYRPTVNHVTPTYVEFRDGLPYQLYYFWLWYHQ